MPTPLVELPWGSRSTSRMTRPREARAADRLTAVVVFPTPPFWLTIANVFPVGCDPISVCGFCGCDDEGPVGRNRAPVLSHDIEILHPLSGELPGGAVFWLMPEAAPGPLFDYTYIYRLLYITGFGPMRA